ncbi:MAG: TetR/AcrR family transcriptional regulator [Gammaproteobacteria bacterium]
MRVANPNAPAKEALIKAALELMLLKGYSATTVDEICASAGTTKGNFFHYFKSKEELGKAAIERFSSLGRSKTRSAISRKRDPLERVFAIVDFMGESANNSTPACLVGNLAQELSLTSPGIRTECAKQFEEHIKLLHEELEAARTARGLGNVDTRALAELLVVIFQGGTLVSKAAGNRKVLANSLIQYKKYLKTVFDGRKK